MRLQVFLSHNGVCSRRDAMEIIQSGRVKVNGRVVQEPSTPVTGSEEITVDGQKIGTKEYTYACLNKPAGFTTTKDDIHAEKTVMDLLPSSMRHLAPVGRLDRDSEGLLLLTNDGDLAYRLTHPKFHADKTYLVRVKGELTKIQQSKLEGGVIIEGSSSCRTLGPHAGHSQKLGPHAGHSQKLGPHAGHSQKLGPHAGHSQKLGPHAGHSQKLAVARKTAPCRIREVKYNGTDTEFKITLNEGRKRQIRMMAKSVGHYVTYLCRLSMGKLQLGDLPKGQWRILTKQEVELLK